MYSKETIVFYYGSFTQTAADMVNLNITADKNIYYTDGTNTEPVTVTAWKPGLKRASGKPVRPFNSK